MEAARTNRDLAGGEGVSVASGSRRLLDVSCRSHVSAEDAPVILKAVRKRHAEWDVREFVKL